jgi:hypothetical protein
MKKFLLLGAASMMISTAAFANPFSGTLTDNDSSANKFSFTGSSPNDQFEDADDNLSAKFTLSGDVTKTCAIMGVDDGAPGLSGTIDLGTIGISAGDDQAVTTLFNMTGQANVKLSTAAAGCNYKNQLSLSKDSVKGLVNALAGSYDTNQFQANIPYSVKATFTGVSNTAGAVAGTPQQVDVSTTALSGAGQFGAWRSALDIAVTGKGLVGGSYDGTLTLSLAII